MNAQLKQQMEWIREEIEIEREINSNLNKVKGCGDEGAFAISTERLEMLKAIAGTIFAASIFDYTSDEPVIKKSFKDLIWLILAGIFIALMFGSMLIYIFGTIKCPCV